MTGHMVEQANSTMRIRGYAPALALHLEQDITELLGRPNLAFCYQCGVCTSSCPAIRWMHYGPRKIMRMIHLGMAEEVLRSSDIWLCVSCYSCVARCPQTVNVADVMATLRSLAIARGLTNDKEATFSRIFVQVLATYGRMCEFEVLLRYDAKGTSPIDLLKQASLGLRMFSKGKISFRPQRAEGVNTEELVGLITWAMEKGAA